MEFPGQTVQILTYPVVWSTVWHQTFKNPLIFNHLIKAILQPATKPFSLLTNKQYVCHLFWKKVEGFCSRAHVRMLAFNTQAISLPVDITIRNQSRLPTKFCRGLETIMINIKRLDFSKLLVIPKKANYNDQLYIENILIKFLTLNRRIYYHIEKKGSQFVSLNE